MRLAATVFLLCAGVLSSVFAQENATRDESTPGIQQSGVIPSGPGLPRTEGTTILYDNGPLVNAPGGGFNGFDASLLQGNLGMTTLGFGHQVSAGNRIADDFEVTGSGGWRIDSLTFFAYQSNSDTISTMNAVNVRIWVGAPNEPGAVVIWGDTSTNVLVSTSWARMYRATNTTPTATNRPVMRNTVGLGGLVLGPGIYWIDWQTGGTLASGPWVPPITINGDSTTGNGLQKTTAGWAMAIDGGTATRQGFPFLVHGQIAQILAEDFESGIFPPAGWSSYVVAGDSAWRSNTENPHAGASHAFSRYQVPGTLGSKFLVTHAVTLPATEATYELSFWIRRAFTAAYPPDTVYVRISTTDSLPASFGPAIYKCYTGTITDTATNPNIYGTAYKRFKTILPPIAGRFFIAFDHQDDDGQSISLDDVLIDVLDIHDISAVSLAAVVPGGVAGESVSETGSRGKDRSEKTLAEAGAPAVVVSPLAPAPGREGLSYTMQVLVSNFGAFDEASYQVGWELDGVPQTAVSNTDPLEIADTDTLFLVWGSPTVGPHTARAWTILATDGDPSNDTTGVFSFEILSGNVLIAEGFNGTFPPAGWLTVNRDGGGASGPWFAGNTAVFGPYEGSGYAGDNFNTANVRYIDDYLISPDAGPSIPGAIDSLTFWLRSVASTFADSMEVRISTTDTDTASFTTLLEYINVPKAGWTRFAYALPDGGARYVAFRYLMFDGGSAGSNSDYIGVDDMRVTRYSTTDVDNNAALPDAFALRPNYPNPFNPSTTVSYALPQEARVTLRVFDVLGREIAVLANGVMEAGVHTSVWNAMAVSSGVYFVRLEANGATGSFVAVQKMLLQK